MMIAIVVAGCGRVGFEPEAQPDGSIADLVVVNCARCGDADGNGTVDVGDATVVAQHLGGLGWVPCPAAVDANLDGVISRRDLDALVFVITGRATATCEPCPAICGDLSGDDRVDADDSVALAAILAAPDRIDGCLAWTADTNGDGTLDDDDTTALDELIAGAPASCSP